MNRVATMVAAKAARALTNIIATTIINSASVPTSINVAIINVPTGINVPVPTSISISIATNAVIIIATSTATIATNAVIIIAINAVIIIATIATSIPNSTATVVVAAIIIATNASNAESNQLPVDHR